MTTRTISVRLPHHEVARLEELARELGAERPAFVRQALQRGAATLMFEHACQAYRDGDATLSHAAEMAGLSLHEMLHQMRNADLELNYDANDLAKDLHP